MDYKPEFDRRSVLRAGAWSLPVVAVAVSVPSVAATVSPDTYQLLIPSPVINSGERSLVEVRFSESALPIEPGTVTLTYRRIDGTGTITGGGLPPGWTYSWPSGELLYFYPPATPSLSGNEFTMALTGPSSWSIELATPEGPIVQTIVVNP